MVLSKDISNKLFFYSLLLLQIGMFFSRALLSISMILMFCITLLSFDFKKDKLLKPQKRFFILFLIYFALALLSYFVSENKQEYFKYLRIWLPFLIIPFAFFGQKNFNYKQYYSFWAIFIFCVLLGVFWSLYKFLPNAAAIIESYSRAKVMPTPFDKDHIRFSLTVVLAACASVFLAMASSKKIIYFKGEKTLFISIAIFLFLYLHLLAVKSGLLAAWITFAWLSLFFILKKNYKLGFLLAFIVIVTPTISYLYVPTFKQKISYTKNEFDEHKQSGRVAYLSDVNRLVSYKFAWNSILKHPLSGVGLGDIDNETYLAYKNQYPDIPDNSIILPHNQWLCTGLALGFPGIIMLTLIFLFPLLLPYFRQSFMGISMIIIALVAFMVEPVLMVQYGVNLYLFYTCFLFWYYSNKQNKLTHNIFKCELLY